MKKEKIIGILLFAAAVLLLSFLIYQNSSQKAEKKESSIKKEKVQDMEQSTIPKWDGDAVKSDFQIKEDFPIKELNEEVLAMIGGDTKTLSETMQAYLYSTVSENYSSAVFNKVMSINYKTNQLYLTFEIDTDRLCTLQGIYDRKNGTWEFNEDTY